MPIHFDETMAGQVNTPDGPRDFSFTVSVDGASFLGAWGRDFLRLTGTAHLQGVAQAAPLLEGSYLRIGLPFRRNLIYQLAFEDAEGHSYRFFGQKKIRYLIFPLTIRKLKGTLYRDGESVGDATLLFSFRTLPAFVGSFRLSA